MKTKNCLVAGWFCLVVTFAVVVQSQAALRTWDGGGLDNYWGTSANWSLDLGPAAGDDLFFPSGAARASNSNNFPVATSFRSISLSGGFTLSGAVITLTGGITNIAGTDTIRIPISQGNNAFLASAGGTLLMQADTDLAGHTLTYWAESNAEVHVSSPISGVGSLVKTGPGYLTLGANDSYSGATDIEQGTVALVHSNGLGLATSGTTVAAGAALTLDGTITVAEPLTLAGKLSGSTTGTNCTWSGPVALSSNRATFEVAYATIPLVLSGVVSGAGGFSKISAGALWLKNNNTYSGVSSNLFGILIVDGFQPASPVFVGNGATLTGAGTVGDVTSSTAITGYLPAIIPGRQSGDGFGVGRLTTSNLTVSFLTHVSINLAGTTAGSNYGQLAVRGFVSITNSYLDLSATTGFVPPLGYPLVVIDNDGIDPVLGEFNQKPEGAIFAVGGTPMQITYKGGTGNDVVVTRVNAPMFIDRIYIQSDVTVLHATGGIDNLVYNFYAATNLVPPIQWTNFRSASPYQGMITIGDPEFPNFPMRFYRVESP